KIGLFDQTGNMLAFHSLPTPKASEPEEFILQLTGECNKLLTETQSGSIGDPHIIGVGVGAPMANYYTGMIDNAPNLGWRDVPLRALVEKHFKAPCRIENDANLAAIGELLWGTGKGLQNFVLVTLGTGVGTGLILEG